MKSHDDSEVLSGLHRPTVPVGLKERALAAARAAAATPARTLADRLWESRPLRLAWAMAVLVLLVADWSALAARPDTAPVRTAQEWIGEIPELAPLMQPCAHMDLRYDELLGEKGGGS